MLFRFQKQAIIYFHQYEAGILWKTVCHHANKECETVHTHLGYSFSEEKAPESFIMECIRQPKYSGC